MNSKRIVLILNRWHNSTTIVLHVSFSGNMQSNNHSGSWLCLKILQGDGMRLEWFAKHPVCKRPCWYLVFIRRFFRCSVYIQTRYCVTVNYVIPNISILTIARQWDGGGGGEGGDYGVKRLQIEVIFVSHEQTKPDVHCIKISSQGQPIFQFINYHRALSKHLINLYLVVTSLDWLSGW